MKKRLTVLTLVSVLILTGCGNSSTPANDTKAPGTQAGTEQPKESSADTTAAKTEQKNTETSSAGTNFSGMTVVDNEYCSIQITEVNPDAAWGYSLKASMENKSSDRTYTFSISKAAINGVQCNPSFYTTIAAGAPVSSKEIAAGQTSDDEIWFSTATLVENGITDYTDIQLFFDVYDSNDWSVRAAKGTVHIYPYGEENASVYVRESQATDDVLVDNEYVTVRVIGYTHDDIINQYMVNLFLVNKYDKEVIFSADEASINGCGINPSFKYNFILPGASSFSALSWSDDVLERNGITEVEEIKFLLRVGSDPDLQPDFFVNETITLNP